MLLDPVCGMTVDRAHARHLAEHDGVVYAFCSIGCRTRFIKEPATYLSATIRHSLDARLTRRPRTLRRTACTSKAPFRSRPSREKVWAFVIDPDQVGQCGPGVEKIEVIDETHFKATAKVGIGFISARFNVNMEFAEPQPPDRARHQGPRPGARAARSTRRPRCTCPTAPTARRSWTGAPT